MSVSALTVITEAALAVGDPKYSNIDRTEWLTLLNQSCRDMARKMRLVLHTASFDIVAGDNEYALPDDCIQIKSLRYSETPSDQSTWAWLSELFEDEYRAVTDRAMSAGVPSGYFALADLMYLDKLPETDVVGGGRIQYWGLPDPVTDASTQSIPIMEVLRDTLRDRMVIYALRRQEKWDAAAVREQEWQASLSVDRDRLEDRSADRRSRIRTRSGISGMFR